MAAANDGIFDPYEEWLGIPPGNRPPDHYALLGVTTFEADEGLIREAAAKRSKQLRQYSLKFPKLSTRLLNEVAMAEVCLLDADAKKEYDVGFEEVPTLEKDNTILGFADEGNKAKVGIKRSKYRHARPVLVPLEEDDEIAEERRQARMAAREKDTKNIKLMLGVALGAVAVVILAVAGAVIALVATSGPRPAEDPNRGPIIADVNPGPGKTNPAGAGNNPPPIQGMKLDPVPLEPIKPIPPEPIKPEPPAPPQPSGPVRTLAVSVDGRVAFSGKDGIVWLSDRQEPLKYDPRIGHKGDVRALAFGPGGEQLVSVGADGTLRMWGVFDRAEVWKTAPPAPPSCVAFLGQGGLLTGGTDKKLHLWSSRGETVKAFGGFASALTALAVLPDASSALVGTEAGAVALVELADGKTLMTLNWHTKRVNALAVSPDGRSALSAGEDGRVAYWDLRTGKQRHAFSHHIRPATAVAFLAGGFYGLSAGENGNIHVLDLDRQQILTTLSAGAPVPTAAIAPGGRQVIWGAATPTPQRASLDVGAAMLANDGQTPAPLPAAHVKRVTCMAISATGRWALTGDEGGAVCYWDLLRRELVQRFDKPSEAYDVALSPDGREAVSAHANGSFYVWDLGALAEKAVLRGQPRTDLGKAAGGVAYLPDGKQAVTGHWDGNLRLWDLATQKATLIAKADTAILCLALAPDGTHVLVGQKDGSVRQFEVPPGKGSRRYPHDEVAVKAWVWSLASAGEAGTFLSGTNVGTTRVWQAGRPAGDKKVLKDARQRIVNALSVTADGRFALATHGDITVWDVGQARIETVIAPPDGAPVTRACFSPNGLFCLAGTGAGKLYLWNTSRVGDREHLVNQLVADRRDDATTDGGTTKFTWEPSRPAGPQVLLSRQAVLTAKDPADPRNPLKRAKVYLVNLKADCEVMIDLMSQEFDAYLRLEDAKGFLIAADDNGGQGSDAHISHLVRQAGTYRVVATHYGTRTGAFSLKVTQRAAPAGAFPP